MDMGGNGIMRKYSYPRNALFSAVGILAVLILFTAGICSGLRRRLSARLASRSTNRKPASAAWKTQARPANS
jgi:hypothetical protein